MNAPNGRLMIMAGGTGGHVFPALAVAHALRAQNTDVTWLGTHRGLEARVVPANGFDIEWISIEGLRGKGALSWLAAPLNIVRAMWQSAGAIRRVKPDCVLGMGGFVAGPGGLVARLMGKPLIVHEQNAVAGLTNRYLAKIANRVLSGFPAVVGLPGSAIWVGNPVRKSIQPPAESGNLVADRKPRVLVLGGSQGAYSFNMHLPRAIAAQPDLPDVWHQCGVGNEAEVALRYREAGVSAKITEFIEDMAAAYEWADLLVCRAGAMTIAECCAAAKPALFIPYPYSAGDHQLINAQTLVRAGAATVIDNTEIAKPAMAIALTELLGDRQRLQSMGQAAYKLHKPDALKDVVAVCREMIDA
ncbi:MAG: undecaprenyldiphospho-muramoylpentapeptide beta-N-acetylglucosaminyltransferase [Gammaproteobacteria bacterium]|nr:undecaprenyldiphospho-muramoylpentapeptide beta-N-acetylglucosaminyltransferase [Gammaproteobacteria bacterium]